MKSAAVAIVGGGVMGTSVAWHLAARGLRDVVVLDRAGAPGEGSTGTATGGFRAQYATAINVRLSLLAREKLLRFEEETGVDPGYAKVGYLWLAASDREMEALRAAQLVQREEGLREAVEVSEEDVARLNPAVRRDGVMGGAFCPTDGFVRPLAVLQGYVDASHRMGVRFEWGTQVTGVEKSAGRITGVHTSKGLLPAEAVVNAAGPWAAAVADLAGVELPVTPLRRQVAATLPFELLPSDMPMTIWAADGFHLRVRDGRVLLLWPSPGVAGRPFDATVDPAWVAAVVKKAHARVPLLRRTEIDFPACQAGLYEMAPDKHAILGRAPECGDLYLINGSSGHGVMHAPALGQLLAEIICEGKASTLDVRALRPERFAEGKLNPVSELL
jgi:glycine/D-amino acid oxidase-like deaminating enzyme